MRSPDEIFSTWHGIIDNDIFHTLTQTFDLPTPLSSDEYVYRAEAFAMTLAQIQALVDTGTMKYKYQAHGQLIEVPAADIAAYTTIFQPGSDTGKALTSFVANAKKGSPRETVARYVSSRRLCAYKIPKAKTHVNPYLDVWALSCQMTTFVGPLPDATYASAAGAKRTHPMLPVLYHHFGCAVPTYEALYVIAQLAGAGGVLDVGSGNGYWAYMLRRMGVGVTAVDSMDSEYRVMWIADTVRADGVEYLKRNGEGRVKVLLIVYPVTAGTFTRRVLEAYHGDVVVMVGTQNANKFTGFSDCTAEEWFEQKMTSWELTCRIAMPSFAGKDEAMFVWQRK